MTALHRPAEFSISLDQAQAVLSNYETLFMKADVPGILAGFADTVIVRFADVPDFIGKPALEKFLKARFVRQKGYRLRKTLRAVTGNVIVGSWVGEWTDAVTGKAMQGRGTECITLRDGLCTEWDATFNMWPVGEPPASAIL